MVHEMLWERLAICSPEEVCRRSGAHYEPANGSYILPLLDRQVQVDVERRAVSWADTRHQTERGPGYNVSLASVVYLMEAKEMHPAGEWVTGESLPAGAFFFRGPHAIPTAELARELGDDRKKFVEAGKRLGGREVEGGDACLQLQVLPRIAIRLVLWLGDEEFSSQVTMLFDKLVDQHLPLDALQCLARYVTSSLLRVGQS